MSTVGISSYGCTATTLEEVFLRVGEDDLEQCDLSDVGEGGSLDLEPSNMIKSKNNSNSRTSSLNIPDSNTASSASNKTQSNSQELSSISTRPTDKQKEEGGKDLHAADTASKTTVNNEGGVSKYSEWGSVIEPIEVPAFNQGFQKKTGFKLELSRMRGMLVKRAINTKRNLVVTLSQLIIPVIFTVVGMALLIKFHSKRKYAPPKVFNLATFEKDPIVPYSFQTGVSDADGENWLNLYSQQFSSKVIIEDKKNMDRAQYNVYIAEKAEKIGTGLFKQTVLIGMMLNTLNSSDISATAFYNGEPWHTEPIALDYLMNTFLQYNMGADYSVHASMHPMPRDETHSANYQTQIGSGAGFHIAVWMIFGMAFMTTLFVFFLIREREVGAKHLQLVSGVTPLTYWLPTFLWDYFTYILPLCLLPLVFAAFDEGSAFVEDSRWVIVIIIMAAFGWAILPSMYVIQFAFTKPPSGVVTLIMLNVVTGIGTSLIVMILKLPSVGTLDEADFFHLLFRVIFPNYNMGQCFANMYVNHMFLTYCADRAAKGGACRGLKYHDNYLAWEDPGIGAMMFCLIIQGVFFCIVLMMIEYHLFQKLWYKCGGSSVDSPAGAAALEGQVEDSDVAAERQRILAKDIEDSGDDILRMVNLYKKYGTHVAVDNVCIGVPEHECFGLLGQNGAGKTTIFKMMTGDVLVTGGNAYLHGYNVRQHIKKVQECIGYCPQFDALIDQLTGRETLIMYARLRGIPEEKIPVMVESLLDLLTITPHADKQTKNYSGGNKRKLSTAIALIGDPKLIMLDEPSAGMDPEARRQLWNVLSKIRASGRTLFLTSHSMEEVDALCTNIVIMVNGKFKCLGSAQHLKNKFGQGYSLVVKLGIEEDGTFTSNEPVVQYILENIPSAKVFDAHNNYLQFQVTSPDVHIADVFDVMEATKASFKVEDYNVSQTTLEQIFIFFTRSQNSPREDKTHTVLQKCCCYCCLKASIYK